GKQWMSWIAMPDLLGVISLALDREGVEGPVNVVAPAPVRNRDFARALGRVLGRPALIPAPAPALKLLLGEMAEEALLSSARVGPERRGDAFDVVRFLPRQTQRLGALTLLELKGKDAHADQVAPMDPLEAFGDDGAHAEQLGPFRGPVAGGPRAVFLSRDHDR